MRSRWSGRRWSGRRAGRVCVWSLRDWWRRFRVRAPVLVAGLCALVVELGGLVAAVDAVGEHACLGALGALAVGVRRRLGAAAPACWPLAALVSGGGWLSVTTIPPSRSPCSATG